MLEYQKELLFYLPAIEDCVPLYENSRVTYAYVRKNNKNLKNLLGSSIVKYFLQSKTMILFIIGQGLKINLRKLTTIVLILQIISCFILFYN